jgi:hypothetical protein
MGIGLELALGLADEGAVEMEVDAVELAASVGVGIGLADPRGWPLSQPTSTSTHVKAQNHRGTSTWPLILRPARRAY